MAIYDCFSVFNEWELLELRLELLHKIVDYFVICESDVTFRGEPKPYYFEQNKKRFKQYESQIIHLKESYPFPQGMQASKPGEYATQAMDFSIEEYQRDCLMHGLGNCSPEDIIIISDLDEILSPAILRQAVQLPVLDQEPIGAECDLFYYFVNCRAFGKWHGPVLCKFKNLRSPHEMRSLRWELPALRKAGWHFSYLGGVEQIKRKLACVVEGDVRDLPSEYIEKCLSQGIDLYGRQGDEFTYSFISLGEVGLPGIEEFVKRYPYLYRKPNQQGLSDCPVALLFGMETEIVEMRGLLAKNMEGKLQIGGSALLSKGKPRIRKEEGEQSGELQFHYILFCSDDYEERMAQILRAIPECPKERILDMRILRLFGAEGRRKHT